MLTYDVSAPTSSGLPFRVPGRRCVRGSEDLRNRKGRRPFVVWPLTASLAIAGWVGCSSPTAPSLGLGVQRGLADHREVDVAWQSLDGTRLAGTLYLPIATGPHPAVVFHFGSTRWTRARWEGSAIPLWVAQGIAVLSYDKRGVGESRGSCCPVHDPGYFPLLGGDLLSAIRALRNHPDIDPGRIGLFGFSQAGWVVPTAAARAPNDVAFMIIGSGPVVTLGEEELYSILTGDDVCVPTGLSEAEIDRRLTAAGASGFDPVPYLEQARAPGLWLFGDRDTSIPVARSIANLQRIHENLGKDFPIRVFPNANHELVDGGAMCQADGPRVGVMEAIFDWLRPRVGLGVTRSSNRPNCPAPLSLQHARRSTRSQFGADTKTLVGGVHPVTRIDHIVVEGDIVATQWSGAGTRRGDGLDFAATGKQVRSSGSAV